MLSSFGWEQLMSPQHFLCFVLKNGAVLYCGLLYTRHSSALFRVLKVRAILTCQLGYPVRHHELWSKTTWAYLTTLNCAHQQMDNTKQTQWYFCIYIIFLSYSFVLCFCLADFIGRLLGFQFCVFVDFYCVFEFLMLSLFVVVYSDLFGLLVS